MGQITINYLKELCDKYIKKGHGDKKIVISDDNEGNGFHGLFYGFTVVTDGNIEEYPINDSESEIPDEIIILG